MYRFFEILPGALSWLTLVLMFVLSWQLPAFVAIFIILFDIYWLLKTIYLSFHLRSTFSAMKKNLKVNWFSRLREEFPEKWNDIYHLVILPMYREPYEVVKESFDSLVKANYPKDKFMVVLAIEEGAGVAARQTAAKIKQEFAPTFFKFLITIHSADLPGEIPGKGSNETRALKEAKRLIVDPLVQSDNSGDSDAFGYSDYVKLKYENILVSVFDIDTQIFPDYFGRLTFVFLNSSNRLRAIYQPIPLFTNNIYQAPTLARIVAFSSTFWQMMQQARAERLTSFSSQSLPLTVLLDIGFWHPDVVSEDSRIFWQGYLRYHGDFRVEPLLYPVSMDANVGPTFWQTMKNNYKQHRRWAWGCENIPYMMCGRRTIEANQREQIREISRKDSQSFASREGFLYDKKIPLGKKWYWSFNIIEGFHSWATNSLLIFALGWLPVIIGGRNFKATLLSYSLPQLTRWIIQLSMLGVASSAIVSILLLPPRPNWVRWYHYFLYFLQWIFIPITLIVFGSFPALEAQTRLMLGGKFKLGFWPTPKTRKGVGEKQSDKEL